MKFGHPQPPPEPLTALIPEGLGVEGCRGLGVLDLGV